LTVSFQVNVASHYHPTSVIRTAVCTAMTVCIELFTRARCLLGP